MSYVYNQCVWRSKANIYGVASDIRISMWGLQYDLNSYYIPFS